MAVVYSSWSVAKLTKERAKIDKAIERISGEERKALIAKVKMLAADGGIDLTELVGSSAQSGKPARKKRVSTKKVAGKKASDKRLGPAPQIYRNPDDHGQTWSGRGRPPRWATEYMNSGWSKEDFRF